MKLRARKMIFYAFAIVFVIAGAFLFLHAKGYVIDFHRLTLVKTGALYVRIEPTDAHLFIDGKAYPLEDEGFFTKGTLVSGLIPRTYHLEVKKDGFRSWLKDLTVSSGQVATAQFIYLIPEHPSLTPFASQVNNFWITQKGALIQQNDSTLLFENKPIRGNRVVLASPEHTTIITKALDTHFLISLDSPQSALNIDALFFFT